ncbi:MAG: Maf family nucleotide pyrophosphatase [Ginsengibacter sp.]|jgi:septum formation protein
MKKIILASGSPRRKQLLTWAEISFETIVASTDESYPENLTHEEIAIYIATNKALAVQKKYLSNVDDYTIIAADTIVVLENKIIGKPSDREDAVKILSGLSGKTHQVITGVCLLSKSKKIVFAEKTEVEFHELISSQIEHYVDNYKPYDKAGAYAIQEWIGVTGIKMIKGDFYNVMGLPVSRVVKELEKFGEEI